jgi:hypothetical protein
MFLGGCSQIHYRLVLEKDGKANCQLKAGPAGGDVSCVMSGPLTFTSHSEDTHVVAGETVEVEATEKETTVIPIE